MNINKLFSTKERISILQEIIFSPSLLSVNDIARRLHLSKGVVSKYFSILKRKGILRKSKGKFLVEDNSMVKSIKILFNLQRIPGSLFKKYKFIEAVGLYGSCAKGENTVDSDVDLWIKVKEAKEEELAHLTTEVKKKIKNVKPIYLTEDKLAQIKKKDIPFYHSLFFGSILICGEKDAI